MFADAYSSRTVLVTGHTGFKGSWLSVWLAELGARVVGLSNGVPTTPSHFAVAGLGDIVEDLRIDVRDREAVQAAIERVEPDFVFHLAAQPLVLESYSQPVDTLHTNILGSVHVLDALRRTNRPCVAVMITSDKCYDNIEWVWGYRETDRLGGKDPYSASKGGAELAIHCFAESFFKAEGSMVRVAVGRAGNVIGGGDWAGFRIVPDCARAWAERRVLEIRSPRATRPWQHVLEPLSGYLALGAALGNRPELNGEAFNFGPAPDQNHSVLELIEVMQQNWPDGRFKLVPQPGDAPEAGLLKLDCDKAAALLSWRATMVFRDTVRMTADWYRSFYENKDRLMLTTTRAQIAEYTVRASERRLAWTV